MGWTLLRSLHNILLVFSEHELQSIIVLKVHSRSLVVINVMVSIVNMGMDIRK